MENNGVSETSSTTRTGRVIPSADRILIKMKNMIDNEQYYEAHQLYRTVNFRYLNWGKYRELQALLFEGATLLLSKEQFNSGADLATLYLDSLAKDPNVKEILVNKTEGNSEVHHQPEVYQRIGELFARIPGHTVERVNFIVSSLKLDPEVFDKGLIHHNLAIVLFQEKNYADARYHFLHASSISGRECGQMLIEYQVSQASPLEVDLFITQFILQVLCVKPVDFVEGSMESLREAVNGDDSNTFGLPSLSRSQQHILAKTTLQYYVSRHPKIGKDCPPFPFPLLNFCWFLLMVVTAGDVSLFQILMNLYAPSLSRDEDYQKYLRKIGQNYFGIPAPARRPAGGLFGNLLQSLMDTDDGSDYEDATSAPSASTPSASTQQQPRQQQPQSRPQQPQSRPQQPPRRVQAEELD
jgi:hypothetical protein